MSAEFRIEGEATQGEALEAELARRVEARKLSGAFSEEVEALLAERLPDEAQYGTLPPIAELDHAAVRASASWEVSAAYPVDTEKGGIARPLIIFAKRIARIWARIAVGPIQREQTAFNRHVAAGLDAVKRQAVADRAAALAAEQDLCDLAGALLSDGEAAAAGGVIAEFLSSCGRVTAIGPCPTPVLKALEAKRVEVARVSVGGAWEGDQADAPDATRAAPLAFLSQVAEASLGAVLVSELSFWLRPEALISLMRRSYLVLAPRGRIAVSVAGFAAAGPVPAWCSGPVVKKALSMAGFIDIAVARASEVGGFVATARRP